MARLARSRRDWSDDDDDEFPDIGTLVRNRRLQAPENAATARPGMKEGARTKEGAKTEDPAKLVPTVRRRKLGPLSDNLLLRAWTPDSVEGGKHLQREKDIIEPRRAHIEARTTRTTRTTQQAAIGPSTPGDQEEEYVSAKEEITIIEEVSMADDTFHSCGSEDSGGSEGSEGSEFEGTEYQGSDDDDDFLADSPPRASPSKSRFNMKGTIRPTAGNAGRQNSAAVGIELEDSTQRTPETVVPKTLVPKSKPIKARGGQKKAKGPVKKLADVLTINPKSKSAKRLDEKQARITDKRLVDGLSRLQLDERDESLPENKTSKSSVRESTPPEQPCAKLVSPKKLSRIPGTPHRPSSDIFWSQEFVDDWNDEHSPRKQLFPDATAAKQKSPTKDKPEKKSQKITKPKMEWAPEISLAFNKAKHEMADGLLRELDETITNGEIGRMTASVGGVKIKWSNKLLTTAGRAYYKKRSTTLQAPDGTILPGLREEHHASIELSEKIIDSQFRLLNTVAHEFCHLANFMISGIHNNPHGKEFKAWGELVSNAFRHWEIEVTTKHSYTINFKYVWECVSCGREYKRHSKSIDPARQRCAICYSELHQIKPVPKASGSRQPTPYQVFVKEQMKIVRVLNPGSPQKDVMRIVAERWAETKASTSASTPVSTLVLDDSVEEVATNE